MSKINPNILQELNFEEGADEETSQFIKPSILADLQDSDVSEPFTQRMYPSEVLSPTSPVTRGAVNIAESFNEPFRFVVNPILNLATGGRVQWQDQRDFLVSTGSRAEAIFDVGTEVFGSVMSMLVPLTAVAKVHQAGLKSMPFLRGTIPSSLLHLGSPPPRTAPILDRARHHVRLQREMLRGLPDAMTRPSITDPTRAISYEAGSAVGAGVFAGVMESMFPGSMSMRATGEIIGGLSPAARGLGSAIYRAPEAAQVISKPGESFARVIEYFGKEERGIRRLSKILEDAFTAKLKADAEILGRDLNEDEVQRSLEFTIQTLRQPNDLSGLTSGLKSQEETLLAFDGFIASQHPAFRGQREMMVRNAFRELDAHISAALSSGDPAAIREAATRAYSRSVKQINDSVQSAQNRAAESLHLIRGRDPEAQSQAVYEHLSPVLARVMETESSLWNKVPDINPFSSMGEDAFSNTLSTAARLRATTPEQDVLPFAADVRSIQRSRDAYLSGEMEADDVYGTTKLVALRARLRETAESLANAGEPIRARVYWEMEAAVRADLEAIPEIGPEYIRAREFSKAAADVFSNTFARHIATPQGERGTGMAPGRLLYEAFGAGGREGRVRFQELVDAGVGIRYSEDGTPVLFADSLGPSIRYAEEEFIRSRVAQMINADGVITRSSLHRFLNDPQNQAMLDSMPNLRRDLSEVRSANEALRNALNAEKVSLQELENAAFSSLVGDVHPVNAVRLMLSSAEPSKAISELSQLAHSSGPAAVNGLSSSIIQVGYGRAQLRTADGRPEGISFRELNRFMRSPVNLGEPSPHDMLLEHNLMSREELDSFMTFVQRGIDIEEALTNPRAMSIVFDSPDPLSDLAIRLIGARAGASLGSRLGGEAFQGQGLVQAGAGVRAAQHIFRKTPLHKLQELSIRAARNPEFMAEVLSRRYTPENERMLRNRIGAYMYEAGMTFRKDDIEEDEMGYNIIRLWD